MHFLASITFPDRAPDGRDLTQANAGLLFDLQAAFGAVDTSRAGFWRDFAADASFSDDATAYEIRAEWTSRQRDILDRLAGDWARRARIVCAIVVHCDGEVIFAHTAAPPVTHAPKFPEVDAFDVAA